MVRFDTGKSALYRERASHMLWSCRGAAYAGNMEVYPLSSVPSGIIRYVDLDELLGGYEKVALGDFDSLSGFSTEELVRELSGRADSPFQDMDLDSLNSRVAMREYVVGYPADGRVCFVAFFSTEEEARKFLRKKTLGKTANHASRYSVYRAVYVDLTS